FLEAADDDVQVAVQGELAQRLRGAVIRQADVLRLDHPAFAQRYRLEQRVLQLPHIARPVVAGQPFQRRRGQARQGTADLPAGLVEKVQCQRLQAVQAFA